MQGVLERLRSSASLGWSGSKGDGTSRRRPKNNPDRGHTPPSTQPRARAPTTGSSSSVSAAAAATTQPSATTTAARRQLDLVLTPPSLFQPGHESGILGEGDLEQIDAFLPAIYTGYAWGLMYSLGNHGASYSTFYRRVKGKTPSVLVVRTAENEVFGGFTTTPWAVNVTATGPAYYGTGESFLFKLNGGREQQQQQIQREEEQPQQQHPKNKETAAARAVRGGIEVFPWSRHNNYNMMSTETSLAMGGGGGSYGLFIGENFESGVSGSCETYLNPPLASTGRHFDVLDLECWTLEQPTIILAREQQLSERRGSMHARSLSLDPRHGTGHGLHSPYHSVYQSFDADEREAGSGGTWPRRSRSMGPAAAAFSQHSSND